MSLMVHNWRVLEHRLPQLNSGDVCSLAIVSYQVSNGVGGDGVLSTGGCWPLGHISLTHLLAFCFGPRDPWSKREEIHQGQHIK